MNSVASSEPKLSKGVLFLLGVDELTILGEAATPAGTVDKYMVYLSTIGSRYLDYHDPKEPSAGSRCLAVVTTLDAYFTYQQARTRSGRKINWVQLHGIDPFKLTIGGKSAVFGEGYVYKSNKKAIDKMLESFRQHPRTIRIFYEFMRQNYNAKLKQANLSFKVLRSLFIMVKGEHLRQGMNFSEKFHWRH